eukprot:CAMPEP_0183825276 /NCGR_PEP_ID=MMETSP0807_2-20130328/1042_1 /TAXON_ID=88271 /ORGANISM="Picocystis salinarum, Strain CCMP1897" /LENGTH=566 /DNA_ID=CAMNT_0026070251 /DNA_START=130 /DNA_END=1830 /DNA_ORIENTATION=+
MRSTRLRLMAAASLFSSSSYLSMVNLAGEDAHERLEHTRQVDASLQAWLMERGVSMRQAAVRYLDERRGRGLLHAKSEVSVHNLTPASPPAPGRSDPMSTDGTGNFDAAKERQVNIQDDTKTETPSRLRWTLWKPWRKDERSLTSTSDSVAAGRTTISTKEKREEHVPMDEQEERIGSERFLCGCDLRDAILPDPSLRQRLLNRGIHDEWTVLATQVAVHKSLGLHSPLHSYLEAIQIPVMEPHPDADRDLTLAIEASRKAWRLKWERGCEEEAEECLQDILKSQSLEYNSEKVKGPTWDDFLWSQHMVRSRAVGLHVRGNELLCVVPGLDFANHDPVAPNATWQVLEDPSSQQGDQVWLVQVGDRSLRDGDEISVQYGAEKPNQELLFNYGFVVPGNPYKTIAVHAPLPPIQEWDDLLHAKANLLIQNKLVPRVLLGDPSKVKHSDDLPLESMQVLAVLAAREKDLKRWLDATNTNIALNSEDWMAAYTLLAWLLENKIQWLEEKTGSPIEDRKLIKHEESTMDPSRLQHVIHRLEQKELAREWLDWTRIKILSSAKNNASLPEG